MLKYVKYVLVAFIVTALSFVLIALAIEIYSDKKIDSAVDSLLEEGDSTYPAGDAQPDRTLQMGDPFAVLSIDYESGSKRLPIVEGSAKEELRAGVGHYQGTAFPGEVGNMSIAGHRIGWGSPFRNLDMLRTCDRIVVSEGGWDYVYHVLPGGVLESGEPNVSDSSRCFSESQDYVDLLSDLGVYGVSVSSPHDIFNTDPVPSSRASNGAVPEMGLITLTTCSPWWDNSSRLIIHGILTKSFRRS